MAVNSSFLADFVELSIDKENSDAEQMQEDGDLVDTLDNVSKLQNSRRYRDITQKVEDALIDKKGKGFVVDDQLIVDCNALSVEIENEIVIIHNFIRDKYQLKFPELESLVRHPIDYARVVKKIGNEMDLTLVDLRGLQPSAIIMVVSDKASTTIGKPLPEDVLHKALEACDRALALDSAKKKVLDFFQSRMGFIAPNLSAIVGSALAAKLIHASGGLSSLAKMSAWHVLALGTKLENFAGFSSATFPFYIGYIEQTEISQSTPPSLRTQVCLQLAHKSTLAAHMDSTRGELTGEFGRSLREEILNKIEKLQEPRPAKHPRPPPYFSNLRIKRGRYAQQSRMMTPRRVITETRKLASYMRLFGVSEESSLKDGLGEDPGMLGQAGSGSLRVSEGAKQPHQA